jgi:hypothetical protein
MFQHPMISVPLPNTLHPLQLPKSTLISLLDHLPLRHRRPNQRFPLVKQWQAHNLCAATSLCVLQRTAGNLDRSLQCNSPFVLPWLLQVVAFAGEESEDYAQGTAVATPGDISAAEISAASAAVAFSAATVPEQSGQPFPPKHLTACHHGDADAGQGGGHPPEVGEAFLVCA